MAVSDHSPYRRTARWRSTHNQRTPSLPQERHRTVEDLHRDERGILDLCGAAVGSCRARRLPRRTYRCPLHPNPRAHPQVVSPQEEGGRFSSSSSTMMVLLCFALPSSLFFNNLLFLMTPERRRSQPQHSVPDHFLLLLLWCVVVCCGVLLCCCCGCGCHVADVALVVAVLDHVPVFVLVLLLSVLVFLFAH